MERIHPCRIHKSSTSECKCIYVYFQVKQSCSRHQCLGQGGAPFPRSRAVITLSTLPNYAILAGLHKPFLSRTQLSCHHCQISGSRNTSQCLIFSNVRFLVNRWLSSACHVPPLSVDVIGAAILLFPLVLTRPPCAPPFAGPAMHAQKQSMAAI